MITKMYESGNLPGFYSSAHNIHTGNAMHRIRPQTIAVEYIQ